MLSFNQLLNIKGTTRKRFWYICGSDHTLVQSAIELAKDHIYGGVTSVCLSVLTGADDLDAELATFVDLPYFEERKLVIVYESEKIKDWEAVTSLLLASDSSTFAIFVAKNPFEDNHSSAKLFVNNKHGRAIKCSQLSEATVKKWVRSRIPISDSALNRLLSRYNNDTEWLLNKIRILEHLNVEEISSPLVDAVCSDTGVDSFERSLIRFDKKQCFLYIKDRGVNSISTARISDDALNLSLLKIASGHNSKQIRPLEDKTGLSRREIEEYLDKVAYYDHTTALRCFKTLTTLHNRLLANDKLAYLALVCRW